MPRFTVVFYERENGQKPAWDFIMELDAKMKAKVLRGLEILEECGTELREPYTKPLGDGIFELRIKAASNISRVLYFFVSGNTIVTTNGFIKKTDKTPPAEVKKAKAYRKDHLNRLEEK